ncbi:hypothetical protein IFM89_037830, partial [Coptis chinensis]
MLREEVDRYKRFAERLEPFIADTVHVVNDFIGQKKKILVEGGQATMLDIDFGTYPFVTSSTPSAGGICTGLGIAPRVLGDLIGVVSILEFHFPGDLILTASFPTARTCHCFIEKLKKGHSFDNEMSKGERNARTGPQ